MPPSALPAIYSPSALPSELASTSSLRYAIATAGKPASTMPKAARDQTSAPKPCVSVAANVSSAPTSRAATISGLRPRRSASRLAGISISAIDSVPAESTVLARAAPLPNSAENSGSSGCTP
ncbi:hypothetical protein D3C85_1254690 [compost metagenome]